MSDPAARPPRRTGPVRGQDRRRRPGHTTTATRLVDPAAGAAGIAADRIAALLPAAGTEQHDHRRPHHNRDGDGDGDNDSDKCRPRHGGERRGGVRTHGSSTQRCDVGGGTPSWWGGDRRGPGAGGWGRRRGAPRDGRAGQRRTG